MRRWPARDDRDSGPHRARGAAATAALEQSAPAPSPCTVTAPSAPTSASAPKRANTASGTDAAHRARPTCGTTRSSACPSSNAHHPTQRPGASGRGSRGRRRRSPPRPRRDRRRPVCGARAGTRSHPRRRGAPPSSTAATVSARRIGSPYRLHRRRRRAETRGPGRAAPRICATSRYHCSTVTSIRSLAPRPLRAHRTRPRCCACPSQSAASSW